MNTDWAPSRIAAQRAERRRSKLCPQINLWGFVSIMLAILFLLIGDTTPDIHQWPPVDLPAAYNAVSQPNARREDALRIFVMRDGRVYFQHSEVPITELPGMILSAQTRGAEQTVYLSADARAKYGDVRAVLYQVQKVEITQVVLIAYKRGAGPM